MSRNLEDRSYTVARSKLPKIKLSPLPLAGLVWVAGILPIVFPWYVYSTAKNAMGDVLDRVLEEPTSEFSQSIVNHLGISDIEFWSWLYHWYPLVCVGCGALIIIGTVSVVRWDKKIRGV